MGLLRLLLLSFLRQCSERIGLTCSVLALFWIREGRSVCLVSYRFIPLSVLFFTPRYRSSFVQGYFPCRPHREGQGQFSPRSRDTQCTARDGASPPMKRGAREEEASRDIAEQRDQAESSERAAVDHCPAPVAPSKEREQEKQSQIQESHGGDQSAGSTSAVKPLDPPGYTTQELSNDDKGGVQEDGGDSLLTPAEAKEPTSFAGQLSADKPQDGQKDEQGGLPVKSPPAADAAPLITSTEVGAPVSNVAGECIGASLEFPIPWGLGSDNNTNADSAVLPVAGEPRGSQPALPVLPSPAAQFSTDASQLHGPVGMEVEDKIALSGDVTQGGGDVEKRLVQVLPHLDGDNEGTQVQVSNGRLAEEANNGESGSNAEVPNDVSEKTGNPQEASCIERPHEANVTAADIQSTGLCSSDAAPQETIIQNTNTAPADVPASVSLAENRASLGQKHVPECEGFASSVVGHEDLPDEHDPSECCTTKQSPTLGRNNRSNPSPTEHAAGQRFTRMVPHAAAQAEANRAARTEVARTVWCCS